MLRTILNRGEDWYCFFSDFKAVSQEKRVQEYVNPDSNVELGPEPEPYIEICMPLLPEACMLSSVGMIPKTQFTALPMNNTNEAANSMFLQIQAALNCREEASEARLACAEVWKRQDKKWTNIDAIAAQVCKLVNKVYYYAILEEYKTVKSKVIYFKAYFGRLMEQKQEEILEKYCLIRNLTNYKDLEKWL